MLQHPKRLKQSHRVYRYIRIDGPPKPTDPLPLHEQLWDYRNNRSHLWAVVAEFDQTFILNHSKYNMKSV